MLDLKNCPFCGGKATLHSPYGALGAWISCAGCGLEGPTETGVTEDEAIAAWNRRALQAVGPEPVAWRDDVKCECVGAFGPNPECGKCGGSGCRSALVATPPAEPVVEAQIREVANLAFDALFNTAGASLARSVQQKILALATKPAVKDDETVVEATARNYVADKETYPRQITFADGRIVRLMTDFANGIHYLEVGSADARAALAAKDGRS